MVLVAVVALVGLAAGLLLSTRIVSPSRAAAAAAPPTAGPITVPVEQREISNRVVARGDADYDDPVDVSLEAGELTGPVVVTGRVPTVGTELTPGSVALEVVGRPVIVLQGDIPTYRTLRAGVSGPDVLQLKAALVALGIGVGDATSSAFDAKTSAAVEELYRRAGYPAPTAGKDATDALTAATSTARSTEQAVAAAQRALTQATAGPPSSELIELDTAVAVAQQDLADAQGACAASTSDCSASSVLAAQGALDAATARRNEARTSPDTSEQSAALSDARAAQADARTALAAAKQAVLTPLPASEVVFLPALPRRVDEVAVRLGGRVDGKVLTASGASIAVDASVDAADGKLVEVGMNGTVLLDGTEIAVRVTSVRPAGDTAPSAATASTPAPTAETSDAPTSAPPPDTSRGGTGTTGGDRGSTDPAAGYVVRVEPSTELTADLVARLRGANVRVTIPVSSSGGAVLAVPLAALTSGAGGESRVELRRPDGTSAVVDVETGLAADGYVEVRSSDPALHVGDRVVVGTAASGAG